MAKWSVKYKKQDQVIDVLSAGRPVLSLTPKEACIVAEKLLSVVYHQYNKVYEKEFQSRKVKWTSWHSLPENKGQIF